MKREAYRLEVRGKVAATFDDYPSAWIGYEDARYTAKLAYAVRLVRLPQGSRPAKVVAYNAAASPRV